MELIYIGEKFYSESSTMMSSIYDVEGARQDWGKVQLALRGGESVHIRVATSREMSHFEKMLEKIKEEQNA